MYIHYMQKAKNFRAGKLVTIVALSQGSKGLNLMINLLEFTTPFCDDTEQIFVRIPSAAFIASS